MERPHRIIADAVRTMLHSAGMPAKFWPYALQHFVVLANCVPRGDRKLPPITICTGKRPNFKLLRIWGCRIYALPPGNRPAKLDVHARQGVFLGYKDTFHHALYYDFDSHQVKTSRHVAFDESKGYHRDPPPFVDALRHAGLSSLSQPSGFDDTVRLADEREDVLDVSLSPFLETHTAPFTFDPGGHPKSFDLGTCPTFNRVFAHSFRRKDLQAKYGGAYILAINGKPVFTASDIADALRLHNKAPSAPLDITFAVDTKASLSRHRPAPPLHLRPLDLRRISALLAVSGEGISSRAYRNQVRELAATPLPAASPPDPQDLSQHTPSELLDLRRLQNEHMTAEEKQLRSFSRNNLMRLSNWLEWRDADDKQLDSHYEAGAIGKAVPRPVGLLAQQVFRLIWVRLVKPTGARKSRACLNGSKKAAPWLRELVSTYASCIELPCLRLFFAMCAVKMLIVGFGDVVNAFQQAPPPTNECFVEIDDTLQDWYERKFKEKLDRRTQVIPLKKALQGHPEAGALWEKMVTDIIINQMKFRNTTHERNLYSGTIDGIDMLVCRQVDDFAIGATHERGPNLFIEKIREHVAAEFSAMGAETDEGMYERFNGLDVLQTRDYIKLGCESYIDRVLKSHGWDTPTAKDPENLVPIRPEVTDKLMLLKGPHEKTEEAKALQRKHHFSYRNLLGELVYAYVICRVDIGFAVCFLARFSDSPHDEHYTALKNVCRYLRKRKAWGIVYKRPAPLMKLPYVAFEFLPEEQEPNEFSYLKLDELFALLDAAHGTDLQKRRSVTGLTVFFALAAVAYRSKLQPLTATSSTEAEFYASVDCAKLVKYFRFILAELLDMQFSEPTKIFMDNIAAIHIINENKPTSRTRHLEVQHFAVQRWREQGDIVMKHIGGLMNATDGLTKALAWLLHSRHAYRLLGHFMVSLSRSSKASAHSMLPAGEGLEAGEGVGARETGSTTWTCVTPGRGSEDTRRRVAGERAVAASHGTMEPDVPDVSKSPSAQKLVLD